MTKLYVNRTPAELRLARQSFGGKLSSRIMGRGGAGVAALAHLQLHTNTTGRCRIVLDLAKNMDGGSPPVTNTSPAQHSVTWCPLYVHCTQSNSIKAPKATISDRASCVLLFQNIKTKHLYGGSKKQHKLLFLHQRW